MSAPQGVSVGSCAAHSWHAHSVRPLWGSLAEAGFWRHRTGKNSSSCERYPATTAACLNTQSRPPLTCDARPAAKPLGSGNALGAGRSCAQGRGSSSACLSRYVSCYWAVHSDNWCEDSKVVNLHLMASGVFRVGPID